jgi:hypothetical protein
MTDQPKPGARTNPLIGTERLLVDGTNLLHALRRGAPAAPPTTLIGRLRGVIEMPTRIELVFDGPPDPGLGHTRIASGLTVHYSGRISADALLANLVREAEHPDTILVVTDDIDLRHEIGRRGGRTASARWLVGRLERSRLAAPSVGQPKPALPPPPSADSDDDAASTWRPGRGATAKKGNPKRRSKAASRSDPRR